jgi:hypothetical protein
MDIPVPTTAKGKDVHETRQCTWIFLIDEFLVIERLI